MVNKPTHYENLNIARDAPDSVIRAAYKALIQNYHPDKYEGTEADALRLTKMVNESYQILIDHDKRAKYDQWLLEQETKEKQKGEKDESTKKQKENKQQFMGEIDYEKTYTEEQLYEFVANELASDMTLPGVMAKAFAETEGDEKRSAARYIQLRVKELQKLLIEREQYYIKELINLGCKVSSNSLKPWQLEKWKVTTKQKLIYPANEVHNLKFIIEHCRKAEVSAAIKAAAAKAKTDYSWTDAFLDCVIFIVELIKFCVKSIIVLIVLICVLYGIVAIVGSFMKN
jgi:hypothetical protein